MPEPLMSSGRRLSLRAEHGGANPGGRPRAHWLGSCLPSITSSSHPVRRHSRRPHVTGETEASGDALQSRQPHQRLTRSSPWPPDLWLLLGCGGREHKGKTGAGGQF